MLNDVTRRYSQIVIRNFGEKRESKPEENIYIIYNKIYHDITVQSFISSSIILTPDLPFNILQFCYKQRTNVFAPGTVSMLCCTKYAKRGLNNKENILSPALQSG